MNKKIKIEIDFDSRLDIKNSIDEILKQMVFSDVGDSPKFSYQIYRTGQYKEQIINGKLCIVIGSKMNNKTK